MRARKLGVLLATALAATGLPSARPAQAQMLPPVEVCIVIGKVSFGAMQTASFPGTAPAVATTYTFVGVQLICAGNRGFGICAALSPGAWDPASPPLSGGFSGTYQYVCTVGGCSGNVGGPRSSLNVGGEHLPPVPPFGPWSYTRGPFILGWLDCAGEDPDSFGAIALVSLPDLWLPNFSQSVGDLDGDGIPDVTTRYDCILIGGVAIIL